MESDVRKSREKFEKKQERIKDEINKRAIKAEEDPNQTTL